MAGQGQETKSIFSGFPSAPSLSSLTDSANELSKNAGNLISNSGATESVNSSINMVQDNVNKYFGNSTAVLYGIITLIIVSAFIGLIIYYALNDQMINQKKTLIDGTDRPILCNNLTEFKIKQKYDDTNGKRRSIGFWIYIDDISKYQKTGGFRHIMHIGKSSQVIAGASPYLALDGNTNKMYIRFAHYKDETNPKISESSGRKLNDITDSEDLLYSDGSVTGVAIDYIPLQRWVNVVVAVNDIDGGIISIYIDGELSKTIDNTFIKNSIKSGKTLNVSELNLTANGSLWVGGNINDAEIGLTGFSGLISKVSIYNYDLNKNDVYKEYTAGPFNGLLSRLGLENYGLRNPIYKIQDYN